MSSLLEAASGSRLRVFLPREYENDVSPLILHRHHVRERIFPCNPPDINAGRLINPGPRCVERLVTKGLNHLHELWLGPFARHFSNKTDDPRHSLPTEPQ